MSVLVRGGGGADPDSSCLKLTLTDPSWCHLTWAATTKNRKNRNLKVRSIDLHGYTLDEANKTIENFINKAFSENINKLVVVTGKGLHSENEKDPFVSKDLGILKYSVPEFITNNVSLMNMINEITDAKIEDGGAGAFYIFLKKK